jgi:hypothetical protein
VWTLLLFAGGFTFLPEEKNLVTTLDIQCIRNSMTSKQECPVCRKSANEGQIRPMVALEEVVESWKTARYITDYSDPSGLTANHVRRALVLTLATADSDSSRSTQEERFNTVAGPSTPSKRRKLAPKDGEG